MDASDWNRRYAGSELVWTAQANLALTEEVGALAPARALDLACGEGRNAVWLAHRGWQATGVDFSAVAIEKARRLAEHRGVEVTWLVRDLTGWEPPAAAYDLVVVLYLQVPAGVRGPALRAAARALESGGTLLVIGHDSDNIAHGVGGPQDPAVLYRAADVVDDLAPVPDLVVERAERVTRQVPGAGDALDALVRVRRS